MKNKKNGVRFTVPVTKKGWLMSKKLIEIVIAAIMLFGIFGLMACTTKEEQMGKVYTLQEAYDKGFVTADELRSIAYYFHDGVEWAHIGKDENDKDVYVSNQPIDYLPIQKVPETISEETEKTLKESVAFDLRNNSFHPITGEKLRPNVNARDVIIGRYYGTYSGAVVFSSIVNSNSDGDTDNAIVTKYYQIAGIIFHEVSNAGGSTNGIRITVWKAN